MLAGRVRRSRRHHREPGPRAHVQHSAAPAVHHRGYQSRGQLRDRQHIGPQHVSDPRPVRLVGQSLIADASVVHQDIYRPGPLTCFGQGPVYISLIGQIDRQGQYLQLLVSCQQAGPQLVEPPGPPGQQNERSGPRRDLYGKLTADPRRSAGDQDGTAIDGRTRVPGHDHTSVC
jgi:hypothetical protein